MKTESTRGLFSKAANRISKMSSKQTGKYRKHTYGFILFAILVFVGTYSVPRDKSFQYSDYKLDTVASEDIVAPIYFNINKEEDEIDAERKEAMNKILPRYDHDNSINEQAENNINEFFDQYSEFRKLYMEYENNRTLLQTQNRDADSLLIIELEDLQSRIDNIKNRFREQYIDIDKTNWGFLKVIDENALSIFRTNCVQILKDIQVKGFVNVSKTQREFEDADITLIENGNKSVRNISEFNDSKTIQEDVSSRLLSIYSLEGDTINAALEILIQHFITPNIKYNSEETSNLRAEASGKVPITRGFVLKGQIIIRAGDPITEEHFQKIQSLRQALAEDELTQSRLTHTLMLAGQAGFFTILLVFFVIYLRQYRPRIIRDAGKLTLLFLIFLLQILFVYIVVQKFGQSEFLIPTTICSMLLAILFDGGIGFYGTIILSFIVGGILGNDFTIALYAFTGGIAAVLSVRRIRTRSHFTKSAFYILISYAIVLFAAGTMRMTPLEEIFMSFVKYSIPNAFLAPVIALGLLGVFENAFGVATDMTLLELSDLNRPLLRELAMKAPGTYHHSIILGNLSENAAEAIGANSLLARVGCYYHDIGKMEKPEYFIENQPDAKERHESLAPSISSLIISSHIRDGKEIANKYKLPKVVMDFIDQHHGTSKISFFYEKAVEKSGSKYINESDYRYPGPKPQTKEAGIVMLADGVEAASRALKDPSPARIRERVRSIVENKFKEGELDECELTLRDLHEISESFIKILTGMFHVRIEYPGNDNTEPEAGRANNVEQKEQ